MIKVSFNMSILKGGTLYLLEGTFFNIASLLITTHLTQYTKDRYRDGAIFFAF